MAAIEVEVREFKTLEEIEAVEGFQPSTPFKKDDYHNIIGDYHLSKKVKCCLLKKNSTCSTEHNYGFVIRLKNGTATLIGNSCANENFEAETTLRKDIKSHQAGKTRKRKLEQISNTIDAEQEIVELLEKSEIALIKAQKIAQNISQKIGSETARKLREMTSTQNNSIQITLAKTKTSENKGTKTKETQTTKFTVTLGFISGYEIFNPTSWTTIKDSIKKLKESLSKAKQLLSNPEKYSNQEINKISLELNEIDNLDQLSTKMLDNLLAFSENDLLLLGYITDNKAEKINAAKYALETSGKLSGKNQAKNHIESFETVLKAQHNANKIVAQTTEHAQSKAFS